MLTHEATSDGAASVSLSAGPLGVDTQAIWTSAFSTGSVVDAATSVHGASSDFYTARTSISSRSSRADMLAFMDLAEGDLNAPTRPPAEAAVPFAQRWQPMAVPDLQAAVL